MLEYYAGVLILTTNRVSEFDEAFRSRVHISLYYLKLDKISTTEIWEMNLQRIISARDIDIDVKEDEIRAFAAKHWVENRKKSTRRWNGRQIKNAFQTAIALANWEFHDMGNDANLERPMLMAKHFEHVASTSRHFDDYINDLFVGDEPVDESTDAWSVLAERNNLRKDNHPAMDLSTVAGKYGRSTKGTPTKGSMKKKQKKASVESESSDGSSDNDSDSKIKKLQLWLEMEQEKKMKKKRKQDKKEAQAFETEEHEDDDSS